MKFYTTDGRTSISYPEDEELSEASKVSSIADSHLVAMNIS